MSQQVLVKPQGIITEPNKVGQYPAGAFQYASNVAIRSFGVVEQVRKFQNARNNWWALSRNLVGGVYSVTDGPYTAFIGEVGSAGTWTLSVVKVATNGGFTLYGTDIPAPWNTYITNDGRTAILMMRNRIIVNGTVRSFAFDLIEDPATGTTYLDGPRNCGVYQTILYGRTTTAGVADDPAYLSPNAHFSATSVLRQIHADGYEMMGPPAIPYDYANLSTTLPQIWSEWATKADLTSTGPVAIPHKHKIDVYRTREQSVGYDNVNNKYHPISTGSSFYLSMTADWVANLFGTFNVSPDTTLPSTLGEALITNTSVGGAAALPLPPPPSCKTSAVFRGYAFYANRWDPAEFTLLNPYYWGFMPMATASTAVLSQGIGTRFTTSGQTSTSGNPTVTGFPNTTGVVAGQSFNVWRTDTGALVTTNNRVLSTTATTVTGTTNVSYSGAVRVDFIDRIDVLGQNVPAISPQDFVTQMFLGFTLNLNARCDVAAVGLEPAQTESPVGVYPNFVPTGGMTFRMRTNEPFTIRATNGQNFSPKLREIGATALSTPGKQSKNSFAWSENNEPENVPPSNYAYVGQGEIYKVIATRDCLWFFCSDGLFRLSGSGGSVGEEYDWVLDPVDPSIVITNPMCACVHREYVYAYTSRGVVSISSEGVIRELSDGRINPSGFSDMAMQNKSWRTSNGANGVSISWNWVAADADNDDIWVRDRPDSGGISTIWVYNTKTDTWTARFPSIFGSETPTCVTYNQYLHCLFAVFGNRSTLEMSNGVEGEYEQAQIRFQPIYGGKTGVDNYTQKHWQDINLSFDCPQPSTTALVRLQQGSVIAGERNIPTANNAANTMEKARIGFTVPRAWPALANSISPDLIFFPPSGSFDPVKLEGMAVSFVDFTEQRVAR